MSDENIEIGLSLMKYAHEDAPFSNQRGLVTELLPYILEASNRMSVRAISAWLEKEKNIKLSPATIAKAIREKDKHFEDWFEDIEPYATHFADFNGLSLSGLLTLSLKEFQERSWDVNRIREADEYEEKAFGITIGVLSRRWFTIPLGTRIKFSSSLFHAEKEQERQDEATENARIKRMQEMIQEAQQTPVEQMPEVKNET